MGAGSPAPPPVLASFLASSCALHHISVSPTDAVSEPGRVRPSGLALGSWSRAFISAHGLPSGCHGSVAPGDPQ